MPVLQPPVANLVARDAGYRASYDGTGYGFFIIPFAALLGILLASLTYSIIVDPGPNALQAVVFIACLLGPLVGLLIYVTGQYTASVEFTRNVITKATCFGRASMTWAEVESVRFAPWSNPRFSATSLGVNYGYPASTASMWISSSA